MGLYKVKFKNSNFQNVIVIGGTGFLGSKITDELLNAGENVSLLVKQSSKEKEQVKEFEKRGAKILIGDTEDLKSLEQLKEFEAIICCLGGGVNTHKVIVEATKGGNLKRFIPSSFTTMDPDDVPVGQNFLTDSHRNVLDLVIKENVPYTFILNGIFYEYLTGNDFLGMNFKKKVHIYGEGNQKIFTTHTRDVAKLTVKILNDESKVNTKLHIAGAQLTQNEIVDLFEKERFQFEKVYVSKDELEKEIENEKDYVQKGVLKFGKALFFSNANELKPINQKEYSDVKLFDFKDYVKSMKQ